MKAILFVVLSLAISTSCVAQHQHHVPPAAKAPAKKKAVKSPSKKVIPTKPITADTLAIQQNPALASQHVHTIVKDTLPDTTFIGHTDTTHTHAGHNYSAMQDMDHADHPQNMSHAFSRNLPMNRNGSGTAWIPDNSPMYGYMFHTAKWMYMIHGNLFLRYNKQDLFNKGTRGGAKFDAPNMWMLMGQRNFGNRGLFHFSTMVSLDPITVGGAGYPLLFQTGETYKGKPVVDRQHPHDLFSELSVSYAHTLSREADIFLYAGYPGEPALGPAAFVHRPSGFLNPDAPLTHHWVDATHITFGVATLGLRYRDFKLEGSSFTGREPGENRYNFDKPRFDSWSGRFSYNPSPAWSLQISHGFIKEPEALHPGENVNRTTASVQFSSKRTSNSFTNLTALWGMNKVKGNDGENGILVEGTRQIQRAAVYFRYEWVQKSAEELMLDETQFDHHAVFPVHAFTGGVSYDLFNIGNTKVAAGTQFSYYSPDKQLRSLYGNNPVAGQVYLRIYPNLM